MLRRDIAQTAVPAPTADAMRGEAMCELCSNDEKQNREGRDELRRRAASNPAPTQMLPEVLRVDAAGRPVCELLRVAADIITNAGDGPVADCLRLKANEIEAIQPATPAKGPTRYGIYISSKTKHADKWKLLRSQGVPIISTWIDEAGVGETNDFTDLWQRNISEPARAEKLIVYAEPGDVLKGALIEVGAALAAGTPVIMVGEIEPIKTAVNHALVFRANTFDDAIKLQVPAPSSSPAPAPTEKICEDCAWHGCAGKAGNCGCPCHIPWPDSAPAAPAGEREEFEKWMKNLR